MVPMYIVCPSHCISNWFPRVVCQGSVFSGSTQLVNRYSSSYNVIETERKPYRESFLWPFPSLWIHAKFHPRAHDEYSITAFPISWEQDRLRKHWQAATCPENIYILYKIDTIRTSWYFAILRGNLGNYDTYRSLFVLPIMLRSGGFHKVVSGDEVDDQDGTTSEVKREVKVQEPRLIERKRWQARMLDFPGHNFPFSSILSSLICLTVHRSLSAKNKSLFE